ncbi:MAG: DUF1266 domain-containing protein [Alphaproteobacteria bacterium]|nr:DUF1266 domain-containing protein [Alphaproteobacteria bacterium]
MTMASVVSVVVTLLVFGLIAVVIAVFVGIGFFGAWRARRNAMAYAAAASASVPPPRPPVDRWAAGCWGLWSGAIDSAGWDRDRAVQSLSSWYGATDAEALRGVLEGLYAGATGNLAWDVVRAVDLLRIGVAAGYLTEVECASEVRRCAGLLRAAYGSWEELATAFEQGMNAWQDSRGITDAGERGRVQRNAPYLRVGVWPSIPWTTAL